MTVMQTTSQDIQALIDEINTTPMQGAKASIRVPYYRDWIARYVKARNGECLSSEDYVSQTQKLAFRCHKGHEFKCTIVRFKRGGWCRACTFDSLRLNIGVAKQLGRERGGECLSTEYHKNNQKLLWQCAQGHQWMAHYNNIKYGKWCPECVRLGQMRPFNEILAMVHALGGDILDDPSLYRNAESRLRMRCAKGHEFNKRIGNLKVGKWCTQCALERSRKHTQADLEAFARSRGGQFIGPEFISGTKHRYQWQCAQGHVFENVWEKLQRCQGNWCPHCRAIERTNTQWHKILEAIQTHGGTCLDTIDAYKNSKSKIWVRCDQGHHFQNRAENFVNGLDCRECANQRMRKSTLADLYAFAQKKGGQCHSTKYTNMRELYDWQCIEGHRWSSSWTKVQSANEWCPECLARAHEAHRRLRRANRTKARVQSPKALTFGQ